MKRKITHLLITGTALLVVAGAAWALVDGFAGGADQAKASVRAPAALPDLDLPAQTHGQAAIDALGAALPSVAAAYGTTSSELAKRFRGDLSLMLDRKGRLFYVCPAQPSGTTAEDPTVGATSIAPLDQTFLLHSMPTAKRTIYLDVRGGTLSGTVWNAKAGKASIACPPWDPNGNGQTFDDYDLRAIQMVWQRVAEDYAPYDVDVTTELPAAGRITRSSLDDDVYGTRVLISAISSYFGPYGGIGYLGIYNQVDPTDYNKPALVFPENLGTEKCVAEASSHEAGHNLGLSHDGLADGSTGYYLGQGDELKQGAVTGWAPIMGGSYYRNLTQWSKGEYAGASNTEDDLAVINSYGLPYRSDDFGNTPASAEALPPGPDIAIDGVITSRTDVDVFSFTAPGGPVVISAYPTAPGPDLDIEVRLLDVGGTLIQTINDTGLLYARTSVSLAAGTYYLQVDGVGEGVANVTGYSDYASLGAYHLRLDLGSATPNAAPVASAYAWRLTGNAPTTILFSAAASTDVDGTIVSYLWDFGDGTTSTFPSPNHKYVTGGTFLATLTVADDDGAVGTDSIVVTINAPPTAVPSASPLTGVAPLTVQFGSALSSDTDGTISSYAWDFGDGATSTLANPSHIYSAVGTYTARLTVTDDKGATGSATLTVSVLSTSMHVGNIAIASRLVKGGTALTGTVLVVDSAGRPVSGATVKVKWSGAFSANSTANTDSSGVATFTKTVKASKGTVTLTVMSITKTGIAYRPADNVRTLLTYTW